MSDAMERTVERWKMFLEYFDNGRACFQNRISSDFVGFCNQRSVMSHNNSGHFDDAFLKQHGIVDASKFDYKKVELGFQD
jgi:hypothetical protein